MENCVYPKYLDGFLAIFIVFANLEFFLINENERRGPDQMCGPLKVCGPVVLCGPIVVSLFFIILRKISKPV